MPNGRLGELRMPTEGGYSLLYDGDCRICAAFARAVGFVDIRRRIRVRSIQESRDLLRGIPQDRILDAAHAVSPDGRVSTGAGAMPTLLAGLLGVPRFEAWLRASDASMKALSRFYDVLVALRGHLSCGFADASSAARSPR